MDPATLRSPAPMFEEPEWAEEAPVVADLRSVALGLRPTATSQIKVSGPAGVLRTDCWIRRLGRAACGGGGGAWPPKSGTSKRK